MAAYLESLKSDIVIYIVLTVIYVFFAIRFKRATLSYLVFWIAFYSLIGIFIASSKITMSIISIGVISLIVYLKYVYPDMKYRKNVYNLRMYLNMRTKTSKNKKLIGKIMPYNKYQLKHNRKIISLSDEYARGIVMITGAPGSGKTYGMKSSIKQDLESGKRTVIFDYKGQKDIIDEFRAFADKLNIPVYEMSDYNTDFSYDPLQHLNKTAKIEAILNTRKWSMDGSDAHYRTSTQLLIQKTVTDFDSVYDGKIPYTLAYYQFIKTYSYDRTSADAYSTVSKMLEILLTSDMKEVWTGSYDRKFSFDMDEQYLVIFSFISSNKELANSISSFVYKDILDTGTRKEYRSELALYIDEYGTLDNSLIIKDILEKGRSCGILTTLSMQDINQMVINTNQAYLNSMLGIVNTFIIYSGSTRVTAEMISGVQLADIESIMVTLRKPDQAKGKGPTAMYISRYSTVDKERATDVYKIEPYISGSKVDFKNRLLNVFNEMKDENKKQRYIDGVPEIKDGDTIDIKDLDKYL